MSKQVRETKAGKSIAAYVVLRADGVHVATVQVHHSDSGRVTVNIWNMYGSKTNTDGPQVGTAGGWGYDKLTAALSGLEVDGVRIYDHCQARDDQGEYIPSGLKRLEALGYQVIQAI